MRLSALLAPLLFLGSAGAAPRWIRANLHGHCVNDRLRDDGDEAPLHLHQAVRDRGADFSLHTPHSSMNHGVTGAEPLRAQREAEVHLHVPGLTIAVGQELTVRDGPNYKTRLRVLGRDVPGHLNHLTVLGAAEFYPSELPLSEVCDRIHRAGGVCIVNHPGPGPLMWEEGLWELPENRGKVDGIEVYNGQALASVGIDFESRYREATAYKGLGMRVAAIASADTHGPAAVDRVRRLLLGVEGAGKFLGFLAPPPTKPRPDLDAMTLLGASGASQADVIAAIRARRTVATYGMRDLSFDLPGLGEVRHGAEVELRLRLSRKVASITLYREGEPVHTWSDTAAVEWRERVKRPTAYVFGGRDGLERFMTSALWQEP